MSKQQSQRQELMTNSIIIAVLAVVIVILMSIFLVYEGRVALVSRFGRLKSNANGNIIVYKPGFHFHVPVIDSVKDIDMRLQGFNSSHQVY